MKTTSKYYQRISPQLQAVFDKLEEADRIARDVACGEFESLSNDGIMAVASEAESAFETWLLQVIGDATYGEMLLQDPMQSLCAARDRSEENDRPPTDEEAREIYHEDKMDHLRAMGG